MKLHSPLALVPAAIFSISAFAQPAPTPSPDLLFLKEIVSISSGTSDSTGVNRVQEKAAEAFRKLGFTVRLIPNPDAKENSGKMLVAELSGTKVKEHPITFITHADTVFEKLNPFILSDDGKIAHGSGVVDNKGGIAVGVAGLREFVRTPPAHSLRFIVSPSEETGSHGFAKLFSDFGAEASMMIGLEPGLDDRNYVSSRKGVRWYEIHVKGKESHAGAHHDEGINACYDLSEKLVKLEELTDYKKGNSVSVGRIEGGKDKYNIVCGEAMAKIDVRFKTAANAKKLFHDVEAILAKPYAHSAKTKEGSTTTFTIVEDSISMDESKRVGDLMKHYSEIVKKIEGAAVTGEASGGVGDLNSMVHENSLMVDGLGPVGGGMHTQEEFLRVESLATRSQALNQFLQYLDQKL
jgi:glutamate carboxypeptidase